MNENINLCEILKGHEGETFYSHVFGDLVLDRISSPNLFFCKDGLTEIQIFFNGKYFDGAPEICIFPSKDQRDWNKWIEEQKHKTPKIWEELIEYITPPLFCEIYPKSDGNYITVIEDYGNSLIEKSALALLKIHQLIEVSYGGNVSNEEWDNDTLKYVINTDTENFIIYPIETTKSLIAFHTPEQAEEFLSYPENVHLLKDYFMIN